MVKTIAILKINQWFFNYKTFSYCVVNNKPCYILYFGCFYVRSSQILYKICNIIEVHYTYNVFKLTKLPILKVFYLFLISVIYTNIKNYNYDKKN